jgi:hypothetical protein
MSDEEWHASSVHAGHMRKEKREAEDVLKEIEDELLQRRILEEISRLLDTVIPGTAEPNYEARAYGVLAAATLFQLGSREEVLDLLREIRPQLANDLLARRLLDLDAARAKLIEAHEQGRIPAESLPPGVLMEARGR